MKIARKVCIAVAMTAVSLGLVAVSASPAVSRDTSWGCGGACALAPNLLTD